MAKTVFWSWQSDKPGKVSRHFLKSVLERAVAAAGESLGLQESERPGLDHDTKDEPGLVSIPEIILAKIDRASVFIGDVTPVAVSERGRFVANPNVLIELGYAKKALGPSQLILIWNEAWGGTKPEDLPFDLRHRRAPFAYNLPDGASNSEIQRAAHHLVPKLTEAIAQSLETGQIGSDSTQVGVEPRSNDPSVWFSAGEKLRVNAGTSYGAEELTIPESPRSYARVIPLSWPPDKRPELVRGNTHSLLPLGDTLGVNWGPTRGGLIVYDVMERNGSAVEATTAAQWFATSGELWGFDGRITFSNDHGQQVVAALYIIECWARFLARAEHFYAEHEVRGPFIIKLGATQLDQMWWPRRQGRLASTVAGLESAAASTTTVHSLDNNARLQALHEGHAALAAAFGLTSESEEVDRILEASTRI